MSQVNQLAQGIITNVRKLLKQLLKLTYCGIERHSLSPCVSTTLPLLLSLSFALFLSLLQLPQQVSALLTPLTCFNEFVFNQAKKLQNLLTKTRQDNKHRNTEERTNRQTDRLGIRSGAQI